MESSDQKRRLMRKGGQPGAFGIAEAGVILFGCGQCCGLEALAVSHDHEPPRRQLAMVWHPGGSFQHQLQLPGIRARRGEIARLCRAARQQQRDRRGTIVERHDGILLGLQSGRKLDRVRTGPDWRNGIRASTRPSCS
jgi:hypothetical protein